MQFALHDLSRRANKCGPLDCHGIGAALQLDFDVDLTGRMQHDQPVPSCIACHAARDRSWQRKGTCDADGACHRV